MCYIAIEHQELSSLGYSIIRLANYNVTTSLIYQDLIEDVQRFQCTAPSGDFSDEILKEVKQKNSTVED